MSEPRPTVVILAGPNGAGKSTVAPALLQGALAVTIAAGRVMLTRLAVDALALKRPLDKEAVLRRLEEVLSPKKGEAKPAN